MVKWVFTLLWQEQKTTSQLFKEQWQKRSENQFLGPSCDNPRTLHRIHPSSKRDNDLLSLYKDNSLSWINDIIIPHYKGFDKPDVVFSWGIHDWNKFKIIVASPAMIKVSVMASLTEWRKWAAASYTQWVKWYDGFTNSHSKRRKWAFVKLQYYLYIYIYIYIYTV